MGNHDFLVFCYFNYSHHINQLPSQSKTQPKSKLRKNHVKAICILMKAKKCHMALILLIIQFGLAKIRLVITPYVSILQCLSTLTSLIKGHARLFFSRKKSSLSSDFLAYPFIIAYPFIREVRVREAKSLQSYYLYCGFIENLSVGKETKRPRSMHYNYIKVAQSSIEFSYLIHILIFDLQVFPSNS